MSAETSITYTTSPSLEGRAIFAYLGIVAGEVIMGANAIKDLIASYTDDLGGRSGTYEREFERARTLAIESMLGKARAKGANAVIGVHLDYQVLGAANGMMMVAAYGTAVVASNHASPTKAETHEKLFFVEIGGNEKGPFSKEQLDQLLAAGKISSDTPCRPENESAPGTVARTLGH